MTVSAKSKLVAASVFGDGSAVKAGDAARMVLGVVLGDAVRIVERSMPTGGKYAGFGGTFEGIATNGDVTRSAVLYVPDAFFPQINDALQAAWKDDENARVQFAFEVASVKDAGPAGYVMQFTMMGEPSKGDPLAALRSQYAPTNDGHAHDGTPPAPPVKSKRR